MHILLLAGLLFAMLVTPAVAAPPTGFGEYAWGTNPSVLREQFIPKRCRVATEDRRIWLAIQCRDYQVEGLSIVLLRLDFEPADSLAGYYMLLARGSYRTFRELVVQRFGTPTTQTSIIWSGRQQMWWTWPGISATLIERCGEEYSCIEVTTTAIERRREQLREREKRDAMQSF